MDERRILAGPCRVVDVGVDWCTATATKPADRAKLKDVVDVLLADRLDEGYEAKKWAWNGYTGTIQEGLAVGERDDSLIVRISGEFAQRWWFLPAYRANRVTRLDLQVTIDGAPQGMDLTAAGVEQARTAPRRRGAPLTWQRIETANAGATLYLGSRASERVYRLYDKGAEEGAEHLSGKWRYEYEAKDETALATASMLAFCSSPTLEVGSLVWHGFADRGVTPFFDLRHVPADITPARAKRTDERTIGWLSNSVSKTIERLRGHGLEVDAIHALNLTPGLLSPQLSTGRGKNGVCPISRPANSSKLPK